ncbi:tRNase Z TRZ3, mitochondrial [Cucumis sativus]|uniref:ribonuclease Z n=1 Tax=Cucumis sativus TaxID=3659 RepID=A0A0A0KAI6_CUCSA|nr:tRNase Z TRZ3, mitochondrial [Cucumis sativus]KGN45397.1 hypothetical protein Csa_016722 [Cucumis sativus]
MPLPHLSTLRFLFFSPSKLPFSPSLYSPKSHSLFTVLASSPPKRRRSATAPPSLNFKRRNSSSLRETKGKENSVPMEETEATSFGFNKRRAEGRDKTDLPKKNLQLKVRKLNPANTISYVQILGTGMDTQDTSPSVLLFFDKQRFIFNAGEGLQRFCTEHKIKLSKIDHIFLSRVCSETAGGLPGLLLTLAGIGDVGMSVNVWGPSDLKYLVDAMKSFIPNAAMVHTRSFGPTVSSDADAVHELSKCREPIVLVDDEVVKISAILVHPRPNRRLGLFDEDDMGHSQEQRRNDNSEARSSTTKTSSTVKPGDMSVVYVCELPEIKGKFDPSKAAALGLKPGPKYRELQLGNSVMSDHQKIMVHPSDVLGPSVPGPVVLLIDCPTESHLSELMSLESLRPYYEDLSSDQTETGKVVTCVIHLSPASILGNPNYQKWARRFESAQHIMAGHHRKNVAIPILRASAKIAARLNHLCPQLFPAPGFWSHQQLTMPGSDSCASTEIEVSNHYKSTLAENLLKFTLRPYAQLGFDRSNIPSQESLPEIINALHSEIPEIVDAVEHVSQLWRGSAETDERTPVEENNAMVEEPWLDENKVPSCLENIRRDDLEIVLLGTGSSQPSKYRNVSSIYINLFSKGSMLLDCGEGTLGQLKRRYGVEGADAAVRSLRCIWISHIHADHHTGLARILALRRDLLREVPHEPVLVIGPRQLRRYLNAYQRLEDLDMQFLDCKDTTEASLEAFQKLASDIDNSPSESPISSTNENSTLIDGTIGRKTESSLFVKGSRMQSYWKGPSSPVDINAAVPLLKCLNEVLNEAGLEALISFPVVHCPQAYGVVLKAAERVNLDGKVIPGWKIVYSGDTRPCPKLMEASRGATLLIHEATFEDSLVDEAMAKNHSTTSEAIDIGNSAGAYRIILTHFSQRYPKIPVVDEKHMHKTCIAFDLMSVNVADLSVLPKVLPYLTLLFRDEMMVDESDDVTMES